jgi:hypothetical protein
MWRKIVAACLALALPGAASAGPIKESVEKAGRALALPQPDAETRSRGRFWTGIALLAGGGVLATLGSVELGDDETGPDDGEDLDGSDDGEDSDGWGNKALLSGGIAAATVGGVLLITGRKGALPAVSIRPGRFTVRHRVRF